MIREATFLVGGLCFAALSLVPRAQSSSAVEVSKVVKSEPVVEEDLDEWEDDDWSRNENESSLDFGETFKNSGMASESGGLLSDSDMNPNVAKPGAVKKPQNGGFKISHPNPLV